MSEPTGAPPPRADEQGEQASGKQRRGLRELARAALLLTDEELEDQCTLEFSTAGGPGGQHRNKTESGVRIQHRPTANGNDERVPAEAVSLNKGVDPLNLNRFMFADLTASHYEGRGNELERLIMNIRITADALQQPDRHSGDFAVNHYKCPVLSGSRPADHIP